MLEQTFNHINAKDRGPAELVGKHFIVDGPLNECRKKFTCMLDPTSYTISCTAVEATPAPAPTPAPSPDPTPAPTP
jgi:hypothetical protein